MPVRQDRDSQDCLITEENGQYVICPQKGIDLKALAEMYADDGLAYHSGIIGVPITFLDKYCPEQFEILGFTSGRDEFDPAAWPIKRYVNPVQHAANGSVSNGGKVNTGPEILLQDAPSGTYYTADNAVGYLSRLYGRVLVRRRGE